MLPGPPSPSMGAPTGIPTPGVPQGPMGIPIQPTDPAPTSVLTLNPAPIVREEPQPTEARRQLVKQIVADIKRGKKRWEKDFKQMKADMKFIGGDQWESPSESKDKYVANIIQRYVAQRVSALYAKNPTAVCTRRQTMDFTLWDETPQTLMLAKTQVTPTPTPGSDGQPIGQTNPDPNNPAVQQALALLADVQKGMTQRALMEKIARTMEIVFKWTLSEQNPPFKNQCKQLVRRVCTTSVGYIKLGYQRFLQERPEDKQKVTDITQRLIEIERILADSIDKEISPENSEMERLRLELQTLQNKPDLISKEGIVYDFPKSTDIIIDPKCTHLPSFLGAQWVAQQYILTKSEVEEIYNVDLGTSYTAYNMEGALLKGSGQPSPNNGDEKQDEGVCVWEYYRKKDGMVYHVADGYKDFLKEPALPDIHLERFWPWFPLTFNQIEGDETIYPQSDVSLLRPMQKEYNRSRQGMREHRHANRPAYVAGAGSLEDSDIEKIQAHESSSVLMLKIPPGTDIKTVLQSLPSVAITPELYDVSSYFDDLEKVGGTQEANLGGSPTGDVSATASAIGESSRMSSIQSNADDLEDVLGDLFQASGQVLLNEMDAATVTKIAGQGSAWPTLNPQDISNQLTLDIQGGSAGRPNKAVEIANFDKIAPILLQIPGISPTWMARQAILRLDDTLDVTDAIQDGVKSIIAQNAMQQPATGNPATEPTNQGPHGAVPTPGPLPSKGPNIGIPHNNAGQPTAHPAGPRPGQIPGQGAIPA